MKREREKVIFPSFPPLKFTIIKFSFLSINLGAAMAVKVHQYSALIAATLIAMALLGR